MSCPPGQLCLNSTYISFFVLIAIIVGFGIYTFNQQNINNVAQNRIKHQDENEILKKQLNIAINVPEQPSYRRDPDYDNTITKRITHPLYPPEKTYGDVISTPGANRVPGLPINIKTRGYGGDYQQIGVLFDGSNTRLPLYGRQTYRGSNQWNYYTSTDSNQSIKLPINTGSAKCTDERGCPEINEGANITVATYTAPFKAEIYSNDGPRYIPYI